MVAWECPTNPREASGLDPEAVHRFQLLDIVPIARSTVINHIENGYLVLDTENRVLDANRKSADLFATDRETMIGMTVQELFADYPEVTEQFGDERDIREDITLYQEDGRHDYDVEISPVYDGHDQYVGRVVLIRDVTEQRRWQRQLQERTAALERQNEKLDQFASVVSHDLRNPIAVAKGHLEIAREEGAEKSFERVDDALDRMEEITEDVLELARQDEPITDVESIDLARLCERAWRTVETNDATLVVSTTRTVDADASRLRRALENLFRNSIEHGPDGVTIRVGDLPDGFYIEDGGPGIPESERENVLEAGYTTDDGGTGFGLSIVAETVDAHGWSFDIIESEDGGARFEITDIEDTDVSQFPSRAT
ncbi:MAG: PAS domain S-box-containing protein [Natronomonas sp.]|jgi:PAS domain S-box-containing protein|uniref:PAS domain-containing sensor histidine kinase n=1 Tax=Natronomonas sp. TaxID=2184060 RepID=UPI003989B619